MVSFVYWCPRPPFSRTILRATLLRGIPLPLGPHRWTPPLRLTPFAGPSCAGPLCGGPSCAGPPNISLFFFPSPATISFFFVSLGVFSWNFGGVLKRRDPQMCTFGVLGLLCEAGGPEAVSHDSPRAQTCTFEGPGLHTGYPQPVEMCCVYKAPAARCKAWNSPSSELSVRSLSRIVRRPR